MTERARRSLLPVIAIALIAFTAARIHAVSALRPRAWLLTYVHLADLINHGTMPLHQIGDVSPTYLWLMVAMRAIGLSPMTVCAIQLAMLTLAAVFCAVAAKRIAGWPAAIATATLILGNRAAYVIATEFDPKALIFFLTSAAFASLAASNQPPSTKRTVLAALLLGLSAVTHPYGYLVLIAVALFHRRRAMLAALIPIAFVPLAYFIAIPPDTAGHSRSQFYEGNNPLATGAAGVAPLVVSDVQASMQELSADPVYRMLGVDWRAKAMANVRTYPRAALRRFAWKALLTVHNFDVYDVATAKGKSLRLARLPSIPFGAALALALVAFLLRRDRRALAPFAVVALLLMIALTLFVVSARQRNVLLVPLAILGGIGAAEIVTFARRRSEHALLAFGGVIIATALLGIEGAPMREHEYKWTHRGAIDAPEVLFDRALVLQARGAWPQAELVLASIDDYQPLRENHAVSSVSYYRARGALRMHAPVRVIHALLDRADAEAPGDPFVLALRGVIADRNALRTLDALHDPFTSDFALALAWIDSGHPAAAETLLASLTRRLPQWKRPAEIGGEGHASRTTNPRSGSREAER